MIRPSLRIVVLALAFSVAACGVKSALEPPPGAIEQKGENDPSKPPRPLGQ